MINVSKLDNFKIKISYIDENNEVGFILLEETIDVINVIDVFVNEENRRKGICTKLFEYMFDMYKNKEVRFMLEVREDNIPAINLYKKFNFKVIYKREKYYKDCDALIMEAII